MARKPPKGKSLAELEKKFDVLEERHVFNEITAEQYQKFNSKLIKTKNLIINELEDVDFKISNLSLFIKKALKISKNISYYWSKNNLDIRKRIQDLVFPEKIFLSSAKIALEKKRNIKENTNFIISK